MNDIRVFNTPLETHIPLFVQQRVKRIISPGKLSYLKRYRYLRKGTAQERLSSKMPPLTFFQKPSRNHSRRYRKLHSALGRLVLQVCF